MNIKKTLEDFDNIGILTKKNANDDVIGASLSLFFALKNAGKKVCFPGKIIPEKTKNFLRKEEKQTIQISFDKEVSEIYYEKKSKGVVIYITPKNKSTGREKIYCKTIPNETFVPLKYDVLLTVGIENIEEVESLSCSEQISSCTIINIDNNLNNQFYGEINIIKENQSISQTVACLLKEINEYTDKNANSFLLYGLAFSSEKTDNKKKVSTMKWLLKNGGKFNFFLKDDQKNKLLEKIIKNLAFENNTYVSTVSEKDFQDSKTTSKDLGFIAKELKNFLQFPSFFILWESQTSPFSVKGLLYSDKKYLVEKIRSKFRGTYKENGGIFLTEEDKIKKAKTKILFCLN